MRKNWDYYEVIESSLGLAENLSKPRKIRSGLEDLRYQTLRTKLAIKTLFLLMILLMFCEPNTRPLTGLAENNSRPEG